MEPTKEDLFKRIKALETQIADRKKTDELITKTASKGILRILAGGRLYNNTQQAWTAWLGWMRTGREEDWPEKETGDLVASVVARLFRIGLVGLAVALIPAVTLVVQTFILSKQSEQLENQNLQFERQNTLLAFEQTSRFREMLFLPPIDTIRLSNPGPYDDSLRIVWHDPDLSVIKQLINLGGSETESVIQALEPLLHVESVTVASGALQVLVAISDSVDASNVKLKGANLTYLNLQKLRLRGADLSGANLKQANLQGSNLQMAFLKKASLRLTNLDSADVSGVHFGEADLTNVHLREADLRGAYFIGTDLSASFMQDSDLRTANFRGANLWFAALNNADLTEARDLTIDQLCRARDLTDIKPDSLLHLVEQTCPEKINPEGRQ